MKKILLSVVCLIMVGIQSVNAQTPAAIMLMHQGKATMYSNQELTNAVAAAEAGDTIFLSNGTYSVLSGLTIDKPISLIGVGQSTVVTGDVTVDIEGTATIIGRLLDGMRLTHSLIINKNPETITIRKCWISVDLRLNEGAGDVIVDRCYARYFMPISGFNKAFSATNSVFSQYFKSSDTFQVSTTGNVIFTNCNLGDFYYGDSYNGNATFVNCLTGNPNRSASSNTFVNCGVTIYSNSGTYDSCYAIGSDTSTYFSIDKDTGFPTPPESCSAEALQTAGYLGTDGTIIGAEGGSTPYNLNPSLPTVSQSSFTVDNSTRTLNVTLTVTAE